MAKYAENTSVSSSESRAEIERTIGRYGATGFGYAWEDGRAIVVFSMRGRKVRFTLHLPPKDSREFTHTAERGLLRKPEQAAVEYEKAVRQRWRALALVIKAKLEAVDAGISMFEEEFLAHLVLPGGKTVGEHTLPILEKAYETGQVAGLLP